MVLIVTFIGNILYEYVLSTHCLVVSNFHCVMNIFEILSKLIFSVVSTDAISMYRATHKGNDNRLRRVGKITEYTPSQPYVVENEPVSIEIFAFLYLTCLCIFVSFLLLLFSHFPFFSS